MAKKQQKKNQTQGYLDIIKKNVIKMSRRSRKMKIKRQHITIKEGSLIEALDGNGKSRDFILNEDICVWMETGNEVNVESNESKVDIAKKKHICKCGGKCKEVKKEPIIISVQGGVAEVESNPSGHEIIIRDYDNEGYDEDELEEDEDGNEYMRIES
jgi:hypothetical protein